MRRGGRRSYRLAAFRQGVNRTARRRVLVECVVDAVRLGGEEE
jgi:hypothetical protein